MQNGGRRKRRGGKLLRLLRGVVGVEAAARLEAQGVARVLERAMWVLAGRVGMGERRLLEVRVEVARVREAAWAVGLGGRLRREEGGEVSDDVDRCFSKCSLPPARQATYTYSRKEESVHACVTGTTYASLKSERKTQ